MVGGVFVKRSETLTVSNCDVYNVTIGLFI